MGNIEVYGSVDWSGTNAFVKFAMSFTGNAAIRPVCNFVGEVVWTGVHAGQVAVTIEGIASSCEGCGDTYYADIEWLANKARFTCLVPQQCCGYYEKLWMVGDFNNSTQSLTCAYEKPAGWVFEYVYGKYQIFSHRELNPYRVVVSIVDENCEIVDTFTISSVVEGNNLTYYWHLTYHEEGDFVFQYYYGGKTYFHKISIVNGKWSGHAFYSTTNLILGWLSFTSSVISYGGNRVLGTSIGGLLNDPPVYPDDYVDADIQLGSWLSVEPEEDENNFKIYSRNGVYFVLETLWSGSGTMSEQTLYKKTDSNWKPGWDSSSYDWKYTWTGANYQVIATISSTHVFMSGGDDCTFNISAGTRYDLPNTELWGFDSSHNVMLRDSTCSGIQIAKYSPLGVLDDCIVSDDMNYDNSRFGGVAIINDTGIFHGSWYKFCNHLPIEILVEASMNIKACAEVTKEVCSGGYHAKAEFIVENSEGVLLENITVVVEISGLTSEDVVGDTDEDGEVVFFTTDCISSSGDVVFTVKGLTGVGYAYEPSDNVCDSVTVTL